MILNVHERWLLRTTGLGRAERRAVFSVIAQVTPTRGDIDFLAETGGYALGKRNVRKDLPAMFDKFMSPSQPPAHGVAYGDRRYRREVIIAAALHQAGISPERFRQGVTSGRRALADF